MYALMARTILLYLLIVAGLRIMGKRQIGELQPSELVVTILISNIATLPIQDVDVPFRAVLCRSSPLSALRCSSPGSPCAAAPPAGSSAAAPKW